LLVPLRGAQSLQLCVARSNAAGESGRQRAALRPSVSPPPFQETITLDVVRVILSIILPPLGVFLQVGIGGHFWLNILLTILGYIPGIIHAIWVIAKK